MASIHSRTLFREFLGFVLEAGMHGGTRQGLTEVERLPRATIAHHVDSNGALYVSRGRQIIRRSRTGNERIASFPPAYPRDLFGITRPTQRASRSDKCNIHVNRSGAILGIRAETVYRIELGAVHPLTRIQGDCVLHDGFAEDELGWTYFGEYFRNPERGPVRIHRVSPDMTECQTAHEFAPAQIRHVHGVFSDPYAPGVMWASVGDLANECYLVRTDNRFRSVEWVGEGTQIWRAVKLFFTSTHICWITDSNLEQNYACRMDRHTGQLEIGETIDCSGWYGFQTAEGQYVAATTVERGPGILSDFSSVLLSEDGFNWRVLARFKKDWYRPMRLFKFGVISFPSGRMSLDRFYFSGEGLVGLDGRVFRAAACVGEGDRGERCSKPAGTGVQLAGRHDQAQHAA